MLHRGPDLSGAAMCLQALSDSFNEEAALRKGRSVIEITFRVRSLNTSVEITEVVEQPGQHGTNVAGNGF